MRFCPRQNGARASFHPLPNKSVRVRTAGAGPATRALTVPNLRHTCASKLRSSRRQPVCADSPEICPELSANLVRASTSRFHRPQSAGENPVHTDPRRNTAQGFQNTRIGVCRQRKRQIFAAGLFPVPDCIQNGAKSGDRFMLRPLPTGWPFVAHWHDGKQRQRQKRSQEGPEAQTQAGTRPAPRELYPGSAEIVSGQTPRLPRASGAKRLSLSRESLFASGA